MMLGSAAVRQTLERWETLGLLDGVMAGRLREELAVHAEQERQHFSRLLLAATAAVVLTIAAVTFTAWIWPGLDVGMRCVLMAGLGLPLVVAGVRLERGPRREPGWLLQTSGLLLIAVAGGYSAEKWPNGSTGGVIAGGLALVTGTVSFLHASRRSVVMPAVSLLLGFGFAFVFLLRAFPDGSGDALVWALDALFLLESLMLILFFAARRVPRWAAGGTGALICFLPVLIAATITGPLDRGGAEMAWPLDAWLVGVTLLLLRLRARARAADRASFGIAVAVLIGIGLAFTTTLATLSAPPEAAALAVAGVGALALAFAVPRGERDILVAGALALVVAAWYYAAERGEALSAFLALGFTAGVLFWVATRVGRVTVSRSGSAELESRGD